jgi:hypothetical protein
MTEAIPLGKTSKQRAAIAAGNGGSVAAGQVDRGNPIAPFEAVSRSRRGEYIRTRHWFEANALRRLRGMQHTQRHMIDHNERKSANGQTLPLRVVRLED